MKIKVLILLITISAVYFITIKIVKKSEYILYNENKNTINPPKIAYDKINIDLSEKYNTEKFIKLENTFEHNLILENYLNPEKTIRKVISEIARDNVVRGYATGYGGESSDQFKRFEYFLLNASTELLTALTDHKNAVVRCYAFWALCDRKANNCFDILKMHIKDTSPVEEMPIGCLVNGTTVNNFYLNLFVPNEFLFCNSLNISEEQELADILLNTGYNNLRNSMFFLNKLRLTEVNYNRIKRLIESGCEKSLFVILAKYKRASDKKYITYMLDLTLTELLNEDRSSKRGEITDKIREKIELCLFAIKEFPHKDFFPYVIEIFKQIKKFKNSSYSQNENKIIQVFYETLFEFNDENKKITKLLNSIINYKPIQIENFIDTFSKNPRDFFSIYAGDYNNYYEEEIRKAHLKNIWSAANKVKNKKYEFIKDAIKLTAIEIEELKN